MENRDQPQPQQFSFFGHTSQSPRQSLEQNITHSQQKLPSQPQPSAAKHPAMLNIYADSYHSGQDDHESPSNSSSLNTLSSINTLAHVSSYPYLSAFPSAHTVNIGCQNQNSSSTCSTLFASSFSNPPHNPPYPLNCTNTHDSKTFGNTPSTHHKAQDPPVLNSASYSSHSSFTSPFHYPTSPLAAHSQPAKSTFFQHTNSAASFATTPNQSHLQFASSTSSSIPQPSTAKQLNGQSHPMPIPQIPHSHSHSSTNSLNLPPSQHPHTTQPQRYQQPHNQYPNRPQHNIESPQISPPISPSPYTSQNLPSTPLSLETKSTMQPPPARSNINHLGLQVPSTSSNYQLSPPPMQSTIHKSPLPQTSSLSFHNPSNASQNPLHSPFLPLQSRISLSVHSNSQDRTNNVNESLHTSFPQHPSSPLHSNHSHRDSSALNSHQVHNTQQQSNLNNSFSGPNTASRPSTARHPFNSQTSQHTYETAHLDAVEQAYLKHPQLNAYSQHNTNVSSSKLNYDENRSERGDRDDIRSNRDIDSRSRNRDYGICSNGPVGGGGGGVGFDTISIASQRSHSTVHSSHSVASSSYNHTRSSTRQRAGDSMPFASPPVSSLRDRTRDARVPFMPITRIPKHSSNLTPGRSNPPPPNPHPSLLSVDNDLFITNTDFTQSTNRTMPDVAIAMSTSASQKHSAPNIFSKTGNLAALNDYFPSVEKPTTLLTRPWLDHPCCEPFEAFCKSVLNLLSSAQQQQFSSLRSQYDVHAINQYANSGIVGTTTVDLAEEGYSHQPNHITRTNNFQPPAIPLQPHHHTLNTGSIAFSPTPQPSHSQSLSQPQSSNNMNTVNNLNSLPNNFNTLSNLNSSSVSPLCPDSSTPILTSLQTPRNLQSLQSTPLPGQDNDNSTKLPPFAQLPRSMQKHMISALSELPINTAYSIILKLNAKITQVWDIISLMHLSSQGRVAPAQTDIIFDDSLRQFQKILMQALTDNEQLITFEQNFPAHTGNLTSHLTTFRPQSNAAHTTLAFPESTTSHSTMEISTNSTTLVTNLSACPNQFSHNFPHNDNDTNTANNLPPNQNNTNNHQIYFQLLHHYYLQWYKTIKPSGPSDMLLFNPSSTSISANPNKSTSGGGGGGKGMLNLSRDQITEIAGSTRSTTCSIRSINSHVPHLANGNMILNTSINIGSAHEGDTFTPIPLPLPLPSMSQSSQSNNISTSVSNSIRTRSLHNTLNSHTTHESRPSDAVNPHHRVVIQYDDGDVIVSTPLCFPLPLSSQHDLPALHQRNRANSIQETSLSDLEDEDGMDPFCSSHITKDTASPGLLASYEITPQFDAKPNAFGYKHSKNLPKQPHSARPNISLSYTTSPHTDFDRPAQTNTTAHHNHSRIFGRDAAASTGHSHDNQTNPATLTITPLHLHQSTNLSLPTIVTTSTSQAPAYKHPSGLESQPTSYHHITRPDAASSIRHKLESNIEDSTETLQETDDTDGQAGGESSDQDLDLERFRRSYTHFTVPHEFKASSSSSPSSTQARQIPQFARANGLERVTSLNVQQSNNPNDERVTKRANDTTATVSASKFQLVRDYADWDDFSGPNGMNSGVPTSLTPQQDIPVASTGNSITATISATGLSRTSLRSKKGTTEIPKAKFGPTPSLLMTFAQQIGSIYEGANTANAQNAGIEITTRDVQSGINGHTHVAAASSLTQLNPSSMDNNDLDEFVALGSLSVSHGPDSLLLDADIFQQLTHDIFSFSLDDAGATIDNHDNNNDTMCSDHNSSNHFTTSSSLSKPTTTTTTTTYQLSKDHGPPKSLLGHHQTHQQQPSSSLYSSTPDNINLQPTPTATASSILSTLRRTNNPLSPTCTPQNPTSHNQNAPFNGCNQDPTTIHFPNSFNTSRASSSLSLSMTQTALPPQYQHHQSQSQTFLTQQPLTQSASAQSQASNNSASNRPNNHIHTAFSSNPHSFHNPQNQTTAQQSQFQHQHQHPQMQMQMQMQMQNEPIPAFNLNTLTFHGQTSNTFGFSSTQSAQPSSHMDWSFDQQSPPLLHTNSSGSNPCGATSSITDGSTSGNGGPINTTQITPTHPTSFSAQISSNNTFFDI